eukprot:gene30442-51432_t
MRRAAAAQLPVAALWWATCSELLAYCDDATFGATRGRCYFHTKVSHAAARGAAAVLVVNYDDTVPGYLVQLTNASVG